MEMYGLYESYDGGLIDDEEAIRFTVSRYVRERGFDVTSADDRYETATETKDERF